MLISVIIPFFNRFESVNNAIYSVLNQTYHNWELILIDDRSDEIYISNFHDDRIKLIRNEKNLGPGASRQKGVENSSGDFICFLDSDDIYLPTFLDVQLKVHIKHNFDIIFSYCKSKWNNGEMYKEQQEEIIQILPSLLIKSRPWPTCALLWNRKYLPNWRIDIRTWEDYQFEYDAALINNRIACVNQVLCQINLDEDLGLSRNSETINGVIDRLKVLSNMMIENSKLDLECKDILNQNIQFRIKKDIKKLSEFGLSKSDYFLLLEKMDLVNSRIHKVMLSFIYQKPVLSKIFFKYFF